MFEKPNRSSFTCTFTLHCGRGRPWPSRLHCLVCIRGPDFVARAPPRGACLSPGFTSRGHLQLSALPHTNQRRPPDSPQCGPLLPATDAALREYYRHEVKVYHYAATVHATQVARVAYMTHGPSQTHGQPLEGDDEWGPNPST